MVSADVEDHWYICSYYLFATFEMAWMVDGGLDGPNRIQYTGPVVFPGTIGPEPHNKGLH